MSQHPSSSIATTDLPALRSVGGLRAPRVLARAMALGIVVTAAGLVFVPWQQNVRGSGRVVAFEPYDRLQTIAAPVMGRVARSWVIEGSSVKEGDPLLEIVDNDAGIIARLGQQRASLEAGLIASESKVAVYGEQVRALEDARELAMSAAEQHIQMAGASVRSAEQGLNAALAGARQAGLNYSRQKDLFAEGLASRAEFEVAERSHREAQAKVEQAREALAGARNAEEAKRADLGRVDTEAKAKIESARAEREAANVDVAQKQKQLSELDTKISQQASQLLRAPRDGTVLRLNVSPGAELVKAGDPLLVLVPETEERVAELWVDGNDVPLIHEGRQVRIQFEGWPAVQFAGWPSVAVGTFGGRVRLVDRTDDGAGKFRILVGPDPEDEPWPSSDFLRQGARAKGFILLDEVRLGYELWRQANGFPPAVQSAGKGKSMDFGKKGGLK
jgi:adhesin transport system membrane fusion protein